MFLLSSAACSRSNPTSSLSGDSLEGIVNELRATSAEPWGVTVPGMGAATLTIGDEQPDQAMSGSANPPGVNPLTPNERFHVGSITKTFTAALIMLLDQESLLQLNDPISKWFDYPNGDNITVRMLLGHTSGLADFTKSPDFTHRESPLELLDLAASMQPLFPPGSHWSYSNTNYTLLGLIAERVTDMTWAELIITRLLEPFGLSSTYIWDGVTLPNTAEGSRLACGELNEPICVPQSGLKLIAVTNGADWTVAWAAGAIVSTPGDICKWMMELVTGHVVDLEHRDLMITPTPQSIEALGDLPAFGPLRWVGDGLGLFQYEVDGAGTGWGHSGAINGFVANAAYMRDSLTSLALTSNFAMADSLEALGDLAIKVHP
ncbi:MAG: serine hydrolase domain-containing protein [Acidimicrobiales bacterium]